MVDQQDGAQLLAPVYPSYPRTRAEIEALRELATIVDVAPTGHIRIGEETARELEAAVGEEVSAVEIDQARIAIIGSVVSEVFSNLMEIIADFVQAFRDALKTVAESLAEAFKTADVDEPEADTREQRLPAKIREARACRQDRRGRLESQLGTERYGGSR
ncbi:hypothetical protein [Natronococcus sp.]|uniref:hypothetical protein n=1 Tax=Natronococcus sp. TaxID=35747 RepID=UPI003A4DF3A9